MRPAPRIATTGYGDPPVAAERLPLVIRSIADLRALWASPRAAKRLPPEGLVVAIPGLDEGRRDRFRLEIKRYGRACGCAAGGATFLLATASFLARAAAVGLRHDLAGFIRTIVAAVIFVPILTIAAKFLGLWIARLRFRRSCARLLRSMAEGSVRPLRPYVAPRGM
jgi:hypothetical protein